VVTAVTPARIVATGQAFIDRLATMRSLAELDGVFMAFAAAREIPTPDQRAAMTTRRAEILKHQAKRRTK
jgi:hypothetical protein